LIAATPSGTLYSPPAFLRGDIPDPFEELNVIENVTDIWEIPPSWEELRRTGIDEEPEMDWSAEIIDRSRGYGIQTNLVEDPSIIDQLRSDHEGSIRREFDDSLGISSPSSSDFRWYDLFGHRQDIDPPTPSITSPTPRYRKISDLYRVLPNGFRRVTI
jgi:hypothetical protein